MVWSQIHQPFLHQPVQVVQISLKLCSTSKQDISLRRTAKVVQTNSKWPTDTDSHQLTGIAKVQSRQEFTWLLHPLFYMKNIFKLTEIHEYLHGNFKMSNQSVRAPIDSQITRHTTKGVKDSTKPTSTTTKPISYPRVRIGKEKRTCTNKTERCSNQIEALTCWPLV